MKVIAAHETLSDPFRDVYPDLEIWKTQRSADLVIFTGGEDIDPTIYREKSEGAYGVNPERDARELSLLKKIVDGSFTAGKVLGVCRGHQLISAFLGMSLIQDIYSLGINHRANHQISWEVENLFSYLRNVNSMHHQVVSNKHHSLYKDGYMPIFLAREPGQGLCESILWGNNIFCVQFHPEFFQSGEKSEFFDRLNKWISGDPFFSRVEKETKSRSKRLEYEDIVRRAPIFWQEINSIRTDENTATSSISTVTSGNTTDDRIFTFNPGILETLPNDIEPELEEFPEESDEEVE